jgi:prophage regulatory protein
MQLNTQSNRISRCFNIIKDNFKQHPGAVWIAEPQPEKPRELNKVPESAAIGFLNIATILEVFPISRSTWWQGVENGRFTPDLKLGPRTTAWRVEDIRRLIEGGEA